MAAPASRLSLERIEQAARTIDPVFLHTPQFVPERLSSELGMRIALKVETLNPVGSFKGRGSDLLVSRAAPNQPLLCASAGNFGQAMAYATRKRGLKLIVYAARNANPLKIERMRELGAEVVLSGDDFDAAKLEASEAASARNARFVEDSRDLETVEGAGTIGVEWLSFPEPLDAMLIALGNGSMCNGVAHVLKARRPATRIIAVQAAGAPAMVESWRTGRIITHPTTNTIADGIAVRLPIPEALDDMRPLIDDALLVSESAILQAMRLLHRHVGLAAEPSGVVGLAALLEHRAQFARRSVGIIICGGNLTEEQMQQWLH